MPKKFWISLILFTISFIVTISTFNLFFSNGVDFSFSVENPYKAILDNDGNKYIIDKGKLRITKLDENNTIKYLINARRTENGGFYRIQDIAVDRQQNLYIHCNIMDEYGFYTIEDRIEKYNKHGKLTDIIFQKEYQRADSLLVLNWFLTNLKVMIDDRGKEKVSWIELDTSSSQKATVIYHTIMGEKKNTESLFQMENAVSLISAVDVLDTKNYAYSTKDGKVYCILNGKKRLALDADQKGTLKSGKRIDEILVPGCVKLGYDGTLNILDTIGVKIFTYNRYLEEKKVIHLDKEKIYTDDAVRYFYSVLSNVIVSCDNDLNKIFSDFHGKMSLALKSAKYSIGDKLKKLFLCINILFCVVMLLILTWQIFVYGMKRRINKLLLTITGIGIIMLLTVQTVINALIPTIRNNYMSNLESETKSNIHAVCNLLNGDVIESLMDEQNDYYSKEYIDLREKLIKAFGGYNSYKNSKYYFVIYKKDPNQLSAFMTENDSFLPYTTYLWLNNESNIYLEAINDNSTYFEKFSDTTGNWAYAVSPIYNSKGQVVAIMEVGLNYYSLVQNSRVLIQKLITNVFTSALLVLMLIIEISILIDVFRRRDEHRRGLLVNYCRTDFTRFMGFANEFVFSLPVGFIPIYAMKLLEGKTYLGYNTEFLWALPVTCITVGILAGNALASVLIPKYKWRNTFAVGLCISMVGILVSGVTSEFGVFCIMQIIEGIGRGIFQMAARAFINTEEDVNVRGLAYSNLLAGAAAGVTTGVVVGGGFSDSFGHRNVFFVSAIFVPLLISFIMFIIEKARSDSLNITSTKDKDVTKQEISLCKFISKPAVWGYFFLIIIPTSVAYMFLQYTFPVIAGQNGLTGSEIGRAFIINGIAMFYIGPALYNFLSKYVGVGKIVALSVVLWIVSLIVYAATGQISSAIAAVFVVGLAEGLGNGALYVFYSDKIRETKQFGMEKSLAVNEFISNFGLAIGPMIFSFAMLFGERKGIFGIGISMIFLAVFYFIIFKIYSKRRSRYKNV